MDGDTRALTGLRGFAALWVMAYHFLGHRDWMPARHLVAKGYLAVDLFFVLSGFVIALNHGAAFATALRGDDVLAFYRRRLERVYPLFAVAILLALALRAVAGEGLPAPPDLLAHFTMTQAWLSQTRLVGPAWSVSVEGFAYLVFPAIAAVAFRWSAAGLACVVLAAWGGLWYMAATGAAATYELDPGGPLDIYFGPMWPLLRCLCGFVAGLCAYRLASLPRARAVLSTRGFPETLLAAIVLLTWLTDWDAAVAVLFAPLVCTLSVPHHAASRVLRSPVSMWLGRLSYAIYLGHAVVGIRVMTALTGHMPAGCIALTAIAASFAAAILLHECIEKPCHAVLAGIRSDGEQRRMPVRLITDG